MTRQIPDTLELDGEDHLILQWRCDAWPEHELERFGLECVRHSTATRRGYLAHLRVHEKQLMLAHVSTQHLPGASFESQCPGFTDGPDGNRWMTPATAWEFEDLDLTLRMSGEILIGNRLTEERWIFPNYRREVLLKLHQGRLVGRSDLAPPGNGSGGWLRPLLVV